MEHSWSDLKNNRLFGEKTWSSWLVVFLILTWPMNVFLKFNVSGSYVHGMLVDYLLPKIFISDFFILGLLILNWKMWANAIQKWMRENKTHQIVMLLGLAILVRQFFTPYPIAAIWMFSKFVEMSLLGICLTQLLRNKKIIVEWVSYSLMASFGFQVGVGALQFLTQSSVFPAYLWFGETRLNAYAGIAKASFFGVEKILAYGTTSHPNILAGFCVACGVLLWHLGKQKWAKIVILACIPIIFMTQSISAALFLIFTVVCLSLPTTLPSHSVAARRFFLGLLIAPLLLALISTRVSSTSLSRRVWLNTQAVQMFFSQPLTGVGLNQFTAHLNVANSGEAVQFLQPAHHVGLLWVAETGIVGVLFLAILAQLFRKNFQSTIPLVALLPLFVLDHYLLTNQIGLLIAVLCVSFLQRNKYDI